MPRHSLAGLNHANNGIAEQKGRITAMVSINVEVSKLSMVSVDKSKTPRGSSKELWDQLGIYYFHNISARKDNTIFMQLLNDFDSTLTKVTVLLRDKFVKMP
jgi:hypothetical protein